MFDLVIEKIKAERVRQDSKWGEQNHDAPMWRMILDEELGETAKSHLESNYSEYIGELIQSAAVIVAWLESEFRNMNDLDAEAIDKMLQERASGKKVDSNNSTINKLELKEPNYYKVLEGLPEDIRNRFIYGDFSNDKLDDNLNGNLEKV